MLTIRRMTIIRQNNVLTNCEFEVELHRDDDLETITIPIAFQLKHGQNWDLDGIQAKATNELKAILRYMGERDRHERLTNL